MIRVFISVPMSGRDEMDIKNDIFRTQLYVRDSHMFGDEEIKFMDNLDAPDPKEYISEDKIVTENLLYLGTAIQRLGICNAAFFVGDWKNARGCRIEHEVCKEYGIISYCFDKAGKHAIIANAFHFPQ